jgi:threonine synthase
MDVGNPSNFVRILELFQQKVDTLRSILSSVSIDDITTEETLLDVFDKYNYILDPHGAVAYYALVELLESSKLSKSLKGIFLETAHPVKFPEIVEAVTNKKIKLPESVEYLIGKEKQSIEMEASFKVFKEWMMVK